MFYIPSRKLLLLLTAIFISVNVFAQDRPVADSNAGDPPKVGLRVLEVLAGSPAAAAGLQTMDIISKYGDYAVVDAASYFVAREAHQRTPDAKVEIVYWRGRERLSSNISPGRMGIKFNEYSPANYQLQSLMQRLDLLVAIPVFAEGQVPASVLPSREVLLQEIDAAIQKGAGD